MRSGGSADSVKLNEAVECGASEKDIPAKRIYETADVGRRPGGRERNRKRDLKCEFDFLIIHDLFSFGR
jgi:hypothetical protein